MIKIEANTLEEAYNNAASSLECSVTELKIEIIQSPTSGVLGFFKKNAIIVAMKMEKEVIANQEVTTKETIVENKTVPEKEEIQVQKIKKDKPQEKVVQKEETHTIMNDTIMPQSFVSMQEEDEDDDYTKDTSSFLADYEEEDEEENQKEEIPQEMYKIASSVQSEINELFDFTCFNVDTIDVKVFDANTLLIEFKGEDAALLIGKEGYRYKALSYMIFNWINSKYQVQLRLEIAEFLKNQEESVSRYLATVYETIERDGRAQTKILDGVLVQIALRELRDRYHDKYVAIRSTRDGLKYIIINDYHSN